MNTLARQKPTKRQPHDTFFKKLLDMKGVANALLRERLGQDIVKHFGRGQPKKMPGTFIDEGLKKSEADRLYRVRYSGRPAFIYVLLEHKSVVKRTVAMQLLRYMLRIWEVSASKREPLLPIVPLVVYNGKRRWTVPNHFSALFKVGDELRPALLDFPFVVFDLGAWSDELLSKHPQLRGGLMGMKYATRRHLQRKMLEAVLRGMRGPDGLPAQSLVSYVFAAYDGVEEAEVGKALRKLKPNGDKSMTTIADTLHEEGWREGLKQGRQEGRLEGRQRGQEEGLRVARKLLLDNLRSRFGRVAPEFRKRVAESDLRSLTRWARLTSKARSIEAVFAH